MKKIAISINLDWPLRRFHELYSGIQAYSEEFADWNIVWDHFPEQALNRSGEKPYYDGIIGRIKFDAFREAKRLGIPVVNTWFASLIQDAPSVFTDSEKAIMMSFEHLKYKGHRNFIYFEHKVYERSNQFFKSFRAYAKEEGCEVKRYFLKNSTAENGDDWEEFCINFDEWIKEWTFPVAVICRASPTVTQVVTRFQDKGLRIPEDVGVISADNDPAYCEILSPNISSVNQNHFKVGYESARMMDQQLKGQKLKKTSILIPPLVLIPRESTDHYVFEDKSLIEALAYILDNYENGINVMDVVENSSISRRSLENLFKKHLGHTILDEINSLKIRGVKNFLIKTDIQLKDFYKKCGFSSPVHLRKTFKRYTKLSPLNYRKQYLN